MKQTQAHAGFIVGCFALLVVVFSELFDSTATSSASNQSATTNSSLPPSADPLVTVVPTGTIAGRPQVLPTDPQRGGSKPLVTIIEFGDFQCPDCATMASVFDQLLQTYPTQVLHVWKDYPLPSEHKQAESAAMAARCAGAQNKFWEYHDTLFLNQDSLLLQPWSDFAKTVGLNVDQFTSCLSDGSQRQVVLQGFYIARTLSLTQTPSYYINDQLLTGVHTYDELTTIIDKAIAAEQ